MLFLRKAGTAQYLKVCSDLVFKLKALKRYNLVHLATDTLHKVCASLASKAATQAQIRAAVANLRSPNSRKVEHGVVYAN